MKYNEYVVDAKDANFDKTVIQKLENDGVVVITNLLVKSLVEKISLDAEEVLKKPSTRGSFGYITKDIHKRMYDGFLFSKHTVNSVAHPKIISIIESYLQQNVVMTECFLKQDLGTGVNYFPYHRHTASDLNTGSDVTKNTGNKYGCVVMLYLHDTADGAFCYVPGSHKLPINNNDLLDHDPDKIQLTKDLCRFDGPKGSLVIFNEAGWHGPELPVNAPRTVVISGYQSKSLSENKTRTEIPILISSIQSLSEIQKKAIGFSSGSRTTYKNYHVRNGNVAWLDKTYHWSVERSFKIKRWKQKLKKLIRR
jgi:hypothetical protein